jgi:hypothetical protein
MPTANANAFEPYVAEEDLYADLPDGRTILVAAKGVTVTADLLNELRVVALPRRVDEPSQHSPQGDLEAAAATNEAVRQGLVPPHNETQRQGVDQVEVVAADVSAGDVTPTQNAEVRGAVDEPTSDEQAEADKAAKASPKPRTGAKPAPAK